MKEYRVRIVYTEFYTAYIMAESEDAAIEEATDQFHEGKLEMDSEHFEAEVDWAEADECEM